MREPQHIKFGGPTGKVTLEGCRYAQVGTWEGEIRVDGKTLAVTPETWTATRDRSWGIRPVGEAEPAGRPSDREPGIWWVWIPIKFEDFAVHFMVEEDPDGFRTLNYAVRVWPSATGRKMEQLGWPEIDIRYRPGTRIPEGATLHLKTVDRKSLDLDIECLTGIPLHFGCGYVRRRLEPRHVDGRVVGQWPDLRLHRPGVQPRSRGAAPTIWPAPPSTARRGYGVFEHGTVGRHLPTGMADLSAVSQ